MHDLKKIATAVSGMFRIVTFLRNTRWICYNCYGKKRMYLRPPDQTAGNCNCEGLFIKTMKKAASVYRSDMQTIYTLHNKKTTVNIDIPDQTRQQ